MATNSITQPQYSIFSRLSTGTLVYSFQALINTFEWAKSWTYPEPQLADVIKTYSCRPTLPVRIFYPTGHDASKSEEILPILFDIHGGGFVGNDASDDDVHNRALSDRLGVVVVALNYRKAPWYPFPTALHDIEAVVLAVYEDREGLPRLDRAHVAVIGYSAGGNLALAACQLPSIRDKVRPSAVVPFYAVADESICAEDRRRRRYYKPKLSAGLRSQQTDTLSKFLPYFSWAYIPVGQNLRDPLLSPAHATRDQLPRHVYVVAAELDPLAYESWWMVSRLAKEATLPSEDDIPGLAEPGENHGRLILDDRRFHFSSQEEEEEDGSTVTWLLVPDVVHGFDHLPPNMQGDGETVEDAAMKTKEVYGLLEKWFRDVVWEPISGRGE